MKKESTAFKIGITCLSAIAISFAFATQNKEFNIKANIDNFHLLMDGSNNKVTDSYGHEDNAFIYTGYNNEIQLFIERNYGSSREPMLAPSEGESWALAHEACCIWNDTEITGMKSITVETEASNEKEFYVACFYGQTIECTDGTITYDGIEPYHDETSGHDIFTFNFSPAEQSPIFFGLKFSSVYSTKTGQDYFIEVFSINIEYTCN